VPVQIFSVPASCLQLSSVPVHSESSSANRKGCCIPPCLVGGFPTHLNQFSPCMEIEQPCGGPEARGRGDFRTRIALIFKYIFPLNVLSHEHYLSRVRNVSADNSSHKETVACDGFLAYFVRSRMQRRDLKLFSFCSKIRRDRHKFISFAVFSKCP
jgi:hypothetical protein